MIGVQTSVKYERMPHFPNSDCARCHGPITNGATVFAHKEIRYIHPVHGTCLEELYRTNASCPECQIPIAPISSSALSMKKVMLIGLGIGIGLALPSWIRFIGKIATVLSDIKL